tara:strand:+ start:3540 stop:4031 length:492 start_codon:yes stop_codon:yes gene_type:complete
MQEILDKYDSTEGIVLLFEDIAQNKISEDIFWTAFKQSYQDIDKVHPLMTDKVAQQILEYHYDMASYSMNESEYAEFEKLVMDNEEIVVYRGTLGDHEHGFSWTLDKKRAFWFANRFASVNKDKSPVVYQGRLNVANFQAYWELEQEVFVPPRYVMEKKVLTS